MASRCEWIHRHKRVYNELGCPLETKPCGRMSIANELQYVVVRRRAMNAELEGKCDAAQQRHIT